MQNHWVLDLHKIVHAHRGVEGNLLALIGFFKRFELERDRYFDALHDAVPDVRRVGTSVADIETIEVFH